MVTSESDQPKPSRYVPDDRQLLTAVAEDFLTTIRVIAEHLEKVEKLPTPEWDEEAKLSLGIASSMARLTVGTFDTLEDHLRGRRLWFEIMEENRVSE